MAILQIELTRPSKKTIGFGVVEKQGNVQFRGKAAYVRSMEVVKMSTVELETGTFTKPIRRPRFGTCGTCGTWWYFSGTVHAHGSR